MEPSRLTDGICCVSSALGPLRSMRPRDPSWTSLRTRCPVFDFGEHLPQTFADNRIGDYQAGELAHHLQDQTSIRPGHFVVSASNRIGAEDVTSFVQQVRGKPRMVSFFSSSSIWRSLKSPSVYRSLA